jgi:hypothetical protein
MHPLVRDLYKRVVWIGRDYPTGWSHVQSVWKSALRNPANCPSWYPDIHMTDATPNSKRNDEEELLRAVQRGRLAVKEMIGVVQLKKYRSMKQRYESDDDHDYFYNSFADQRSS